MNSYEKLFDIFIAVCIMLIFPMMYLTKKSQIITYQAIEMETEQFVEEILTQGKLSKEAYESFHEEVNAYDEAIQISLSYEEIVFEPEYQLDKESSDYLFTGEVLEYEQVTSGNEMIDFLYKEKTDFFMQPGGYFKVTIQFTNKEKAIYCGGTVRAYFSFCDYICNHCNHFYYDQRYLLCTAKNCYV